MEKAKQRRLEAAGWKVGSARDFLGLTNEEAAYVELKASLASLLRRVRQQQRLSQTTAAKLIHSSQSRLAKMEAADRTVTVDLMFRSLFRLGVKLPDLIRISKRTPAAATSYAATNLMSARKSAKRRSHKLGARTHAARSLKRQHASHAGT